MVVTSTLDYPASGNFDGIAGPASLANLESGLDALADLGDRLEGVGKLGQPLAILDGQSIGGVVDIGGILRQRLVDPVAALSGTPTLVQLVSAFNQVSGLTATGTRSNAGVVTVELTLDVESVVSDVELSLGEEVGELVQVDALLGDVTTDLQWHFEIGENSSGAFSATPLGNMQVSANLEETNFEGRAGFLGLNFASPSIVFLDADVQVLTNGSFGTGTTNHLQSLNAATVAQTGTALAKIDLIGTNTVGGVSVAFPGGLPAPVISQTGSGNSTFDLFVSGPLPSAIG